MAIVRIEYWEKQISEFLVGKTIAKVRYLTEEEVDYLGWYRKALVIEFTDGSYIFPSADDEGNNAGALFTSDDDLPVIPVV